MLRWFDWAVLLVLTCAACSSAGETASESPSMTSAPSMPSASGASGASGMTARTATKADAGAAPAVSISTSTGGQHSTDAGKSAAGSSANIGDIAGAPAAGSTSAAGSGGNPAAGSGGGGAAGAAGATTPASGPLTLELVDGEDLGDGFFAFPESARPPTNQSPPFRWSGGPAAKSYALVFRDVTNAMPPVKWVLWNIPPDRMEIPANVSGTLAMPSEVPGASQLGSLGNQGFAGPCCVGNKYEWIVYALDVAELPGTQGMSTAQINMSVIPMHTLEKSKALMLRIK